VQPEYEIECNPNTRLESRGFLCRGTHVSISRMRRVVTGVRTSVPDLRDVRVPPAGDATLQTTVLDAPSRNHRLAALDGLTPPRPVP
jgi:hypothetical protein